MSLSCDWIGVAVRYFHTTKGPQNLICDIYFSFFLEKKGVSTLRDSRADGKGSDPIKGPFFLLK